MRGDTGVSLKPALGPVGLTIFGITYMTVITVFTTYGIVNRVTDGHLPAAYVVALVAMLFTAFSYGHMVRRYPVAGSAYTYAQQSFGGLLGFFTGWLMLLDYLFIPMLNFMFIGIYMHEQFPDVPAQVFTLVALLLVLFFNVLGITVVTRLNFVFVGLGVLLVAVMVALSLKKALGGDMAVGLLEPFMFGSGGISAVAAGAAVLALSFLGFDAVSTLSEEARDARRDIPRAIVLTTLLGGFLFIVVSWAGAIAYSPDWAGMDAGQVEAAGTTLMRNIGGEGLQLFLVGVFVVGAFGSGLTGQVSVSRILFAMGRDGILPKRFALLHRRFRTPVFAVLVVSLVSLASLFLSLDAVAFMISFGALAAFAMVNLSVVKTYLFVGARFSLWRGAAGGGGGAGFVRVLVYGVMPVVGFALTIWLWTSLAPLTWLVGGVWCFLGFGVVVFVTRGFRRAVPKMTFGDD